MQAKSLGLILAMACVSGWAGHEQDMQSFQIVWETIRDKHWDLDSTGVDWNAVHDKYQSQAEKAENRAAMRKVINHMIGELGQTHFGLMGGDRFKALESLQADFIGGGGVPGFEIKAIDGRAFITKIDPRSMAAKHGVGLGAEVIRVRSQLMSELVEAVEKAFENSAQRGLYVTRTLNEFVSGPVGSSFELEYSQRGEQTKTELEFEKGHGITQSFGNLPPVSFEYDQRLLDGDIGYVGFNIFLMPLLTEFPKSFKAFKDSKGFIIDLRGNSGGIGYLASGLAGYFVKESGLKLGTMYTKDSHMNFIVVPRHNIQVYDRPLAILIDEGSASTSEIFAAGMRDIERARLFGTRSAGAALPSFIEELPNGDRFQYAFANYISEKGLEIEGTGVEPDEVHPHTVESLAAGRDEALQAAVSWINSQ